MKKKLDKQFLKKPNILVFILLIILILTTLSFLFYKRTEVSIRQDKIKELEFFGRSKIEELSHWQRERIADANVVSKSPFFTEGIRQWMANRDNELLYKNIFDRLAPVKLEYQYRDILLTSPEGEILFNVDKEDSLMPDYISSQVLKLFNEDSTVMSDFYYCEFHDEIHYDIVSPLKLNDSTKIANLIFSLDPHKYIYPLLSKGAAGTETGEVLLYGVEQDSIVLLNEPRYNERIPLEFKSTLSFFVDDSTANDMLIKETVFETKDFYGNDVLAFSSPVKNTSWILITKINKSEIFSEMRFMTIVIILTTISIILILILVTGYIYSLRQENIYKELFHAEHELRVSQEEYKTTLYSIGDGVITTDRYGNIKEMNSAAEQLTGWKESQARGRVLKDVFPIISQETGEPILNPVEMVISKGKIVGFSNHTLLISKDGKRIPITDGGAPIRNDKGEIIGVVLVFQDQTKEYEAKKSLMESERKLAALMTNLPGMVYRLKYDENRTIEFVSNGLIKLTGYEPIEFFNNDLLYNTKIIHPLDVERVFSEIDEALLLSSGYESEYRIITKSGDEKWVLEKGQALYNDNGEIEYLEGIVTDITDKKIAEEEKERLNSILESTTDFIGIADLTGKPVFINKAGRKIVGLGENEELKIKSIAEFHPEWVQEMLFTEAIPYANEHGIWRGETAILNKEGAEVPLSQLIISHKDSKGNTVYLSTVARDITDQKEYERKLESSDKIFNHSLHMLCIAGFDGYFKVLNPAWENTLGYTREELMSKQWIDFVHPDDKDITIKMGEKLFSGEHVTEFENRYITKDGSIKWLSWSVYSYPGMKLIYGSAKDVTERIRLENEVKESDRRLKLALKNAPIILFNQDKDLKYTWIYNQSLFDQDDVIGKTDFDLLPEDEARHLTQIKQKVLETGVMAREKVMTKINGQQYFYDLNIEPLRDNNNKVIGLNCASIDITERIKSENELLKLTQAVEQSSMSIIITNTDGIIEYVNPHFTTLTGYTFEEVSGLNPKILKSGKQNKEFYKELWENISSGIEWRGEFCNKKKNGELYWENALISPVLNKDGVILYFVAIKEDVTEKKKILDDLIIAKFKAEESDKLKTAFLHNISHEVRTPLHGITGFIKLLSEPDITNEEYDEYIEIINHSSERLISIITNLISISTLETGQEIVQDTETDLDEIINDLYRQLNLKINDPIKFTFNSNLGKEFPKILVDKTKLFQVLSNLLENAIKFTEKGFIKLEYGLTDDNMKILFTVEDSGIGIPEKFQDVIFDRFRQVETTLNRRFGGNGLGLSISKAYVEMMGGEMCLESEVGKGSKFYFTIPNKKAESK